MDLGTALAWTGERYPDRLSTRACSGRAGSNGSAGSGPIAGCSAANAVAIVVVFKRAMSMDHQL